MLGGTSSIDDMVYIRGNRHVYDEWAKKGAEGWSFKDVEPYFIKAENYTGRNPSGEIGFNPDKCMQVLYKMCNHQICWKQKYITAQHRDHLSGTKHINITSKNGIL